MNTKTAKKLRKIARAEAAKSLAQGAEENRNLIDSILSWSLRDRVRFCWKVLRKTL